MTMKDCYKALIWPLGTLSVYGLCRGFIYERIGEPFWNYINLSEGLWLDLAVTIVTICCVLGSQRFVVRYYTERHVGMFLSILLMLALFQFDNEEIPYLSVFGLLPCWTPICFGIFLGLFIGRVRFSSKNANDELTDAVPLFDDIPIIDSKDDILDFGELAGRIAASIENNNPTSSFSIGITGQWGTGKTSLLNLIKDKLARNHNNIIVEFYPRQSASVSDIQRDFLSTFGEAMAKYHSGMLRLVDLYSHAIGVLPEAFWLLRLFFTCNMSSPQQLRKDISEAIDNSGVRIIVLIDDFDRLTGDEIKEVFKLIDKNAAFPKTFFLTAYDKERTNSIISKSLGDENILDYTDKYFSLELPVPIRRRGRYLEILRNHIIGLVQHGKLPYSQEIIDLSISRVGRFMPEYLPTVRDIKRYVNFLASSIKPIQNDVLLDDFMLLSLIRYKYPSEYIALSQRQYVSFPSTDDYAEELVEYSMKNEKANPRSRAILQSLFSYANNRYHSINRAVSFDVYFYDIDSGHLPYVSLTQLLKPDLQEEEFKSLVTSWVDNENYILDLSEFILSRRDLIRTQSDAIDYMRLFLLTRKFCKSYDLYIESISYLRLDNIRDNMKAFGFDSQEEYTKFFEGVINNMFEDTISIEFIHDALHAVSHINPDDAPSLIFTYYQLTEWALSKLKTIIHSTELNITKPNDVYSAMCACVVEYNPEGLGETVSSDAKDRVKAAIRKHPELYLGNVLSHRVLKDETIQFYLTEENAFVHMFGEPSICQLFLSSIRQNMHGVSNNCLFEYIERCVVQNTWAPSIGVHGDVNAIKQLDYATYRKVFEGEPISA